jgi:hypothetical protein
LLPSWLLPPANGFANRITFDDPFVIRREGERKKEWVCWVVEEEQGKSGEIG